ncbi:MAG: radical SAM protein [Sandaracinaceae bacterium]|nr:radical SAM protein [Sandaracinaceae bacterium]
MSFVVTDRCNSRCKTCRIGERYLEDPSVADGELTLAEYRRLLPTIGRVEWVTLSGGEPFQRKDFPELAVAVAAALGPRVVNVPTNGTFVHAAVEGVRRILAGTRARLVINVSVDAVGADHDRVRGFQGNFDRLLELVRRLRALAHPRLTIGANTVLSRFNAEHAQATIDFVLDELAPDSYVLEAAQVRPEYHNAEVDLAAPPALVRAALEHAVLRLAEERRDGVAALVSAFRSHYYREALRRLEGPVTHRCFAAYATCAIMPDGEVVSSTERGDPMGNVRDFDLDFRALWRSPSARAARRRVREAPCACQSSNVSYPNALLDPRAASRVLFAAARAYAPGAARRRGGA